MAFNSDNTSAASSSFSADFDPLSGIRKRLRRHWDREIIRTSKFELLVDFVVEQALLLVPRENVMLRKLTPNENIESRRNMDMGLRASFIEVARVEFFKRWNLHLEQGGTQPDVDPEEQWPHFEAHHTTPVGYGGDANKYVMMHPALHRAVHDEIEARAAGMKAGETRTALIPYPPGKVWIPQIEFLTQRPI